MAKFKQIPLNTFETLQLNAGVFLTNFDPKTGSFKKENIKGATSGGAKFSAKFDIKDLGEGIDNCPKNVMELMKLDKWTITMSGTFKTLSKINIIEGLGAASIDPDDETHIVLKNRLDKTDFYDVWWVGDYGEEGGFIAIHMNNVLNTNGFDLQSTDDGNGSFAFVYTCHFSEQEVEKIPCDLYLVEADEVQPETPDEGGGNEDVDAQSDNVSTFKANRSKLSTDTTEE